MLGTPFSPWPSFSEEEVDAISEILRSNRVNYWTGSNCRQFEREFADWCGVRHAVALTNGTLALEASLRALGIGPGDDVVVTPRSFMASASCVVSVGARPVFADVAAESQNMTASTIEKVLTPNSRAIICVHLAGMPCDMDPIMQLATERGLKVVEDCAQAHGATYRGRRVGSIGDIAAWSFCQDKIMTTGGEGGMVTTNNEGLWSRVWSYKDHGKSWNAVYVAQHPPGFRWVHESFGTNARMLEIQAAIGRLQLQRLPNWTAIRTATAARLAEACKPFDAVRVPAVRDDVTHAYYRFYAFVDPMRLRAGWSRDRVIEEITSLGVPCNHGSCSEIYLEKAFQAAGFSPPERLPVARELGERSFAMLVHPTLLETEIQRSCDVLADVLSAATSS